MKHHVSIYLVFGLVLCAEAASTVDVNNNNAYGANIGWINWYADGANGAVIGEYVCSGYIYSANVGWINLGSGLPVNGIQYQNNSAADFGVNQDGLGNLSGYAYGANIGWVTFETNGAPKVDLVSGKLSGYAWSANCGWISLSNTAAYVQTDTIRQGALAPNGLPIAWLLINFSTTNVDANADPDHDGMNNSQEYRAGTNPNDGSDRLIITAQTFAQGGTNAALIWKSAPTRFYYIQKTLDLGTQNWLDCGLALISPDGVSTARNFSDTNAAMRFYRVQAIRPLVQ